MTRTCDRSGQGRQRGQAWVGWCKREERAGERLPRARSSPAGAWAGAVWGADAESRRCGRNAGPCARGAASPWRLEGMLCGCSNGTGWEHNSPLTELQSDRRVCEPGQRGPPASNRWLEFCGGGAVPSLLAAQTGPDFVGLGASANIPPLEWALGASAVGAQAPRAEQPASAQRRPDALPLLRPWPP
jgi:hypothetical protein